MRQVLQSIEQGAYVTPRLYVPKQMWAQTGVKLVAVETKVRMLDLLLTGLEGVEKAGDGLIRRQDPWHGSLAKSGAANFAKELEDLEGLMGGIQSTLAKKLGYGTSGKKTGGVRLSRDAVGWADEADPASANRPRSAPGAPSSRARSTASRTAARSTRLQLTSTVSRVSSASPSPSVRSPLRHLTAPPPPRLTCPPGADNHLVALAADDYAYSDLGQHETQRIERGLRRASDFFGQVICQFILRDLGIFLDKCASSRPTVVLSPSRHSADPGTRSQM